MTANPIRLWNRFWFGPISARPLGAFRIVYGLIFLANLALLAGEADLWLSDAGYFRGTESSELAGPLRWSPLQVVQDPATIRLWVAATAVVGVLFTIGWQTRWVGLLLYGLMLSIHHRNIPSCSGADTLLMIELFLLMLSPCGAAFSLDARRRARRRGTAADPLIVPWAQRLIQFQVALVYFVTALLKATGPSWANGTALHYVLNNAEFCRYTLGLTSYPALINALTFAAVILEFALPFLLWFRAVRPWIMLAGLALHGGILLTVNIPIFGELITASYLLFLTPEELDGLLRGLDPRGWFRSRRLGAVPSSLRFDAAHRIGGPWRRGRDNRPSSAFERKTKPPEAAGI